MFQNMKQCIRYSIHRIVTYSLQMIPQPLQPPRAIAETLNQFDLAHVDTRQITGNILMQVSVRIGMSITAFDPAGEVAICTWQCII